MKSSVPSSRAARKPVEGVFENNAVLRNFFGLNSEFKLYSHESDSDLGQAISRVNCLASKQIVG
jgi:hypothetical protein